MYKQLSITALLAGLTVSPALAQMAQERVDLDAVSRIREEGLERSQIEALAHHLTDVIGPRLTGSPGMRRANEWTAEMYREWGLSNVQIEPWGEFGQGWERVFSLNVKGVFHVTREMAPLLRKGARPGDPARVINIGSIDGLAVPRIVESYAYSAGKAAVHHMTRVLSRRLGPEGILVNAIAPGFFPSKMTDWLIENHGDELVGRCPLGRLPEADAGGFPGYCHGPAFTPWPGPAASA